MPLQTTPFIDWDLIRRYEQHIEELRAAGVYPQRPAFNVTGPFGQYQTIEVASKPHRIETTGQHQRCVCIGGRILPRT